MASMYGTISIELPESTRTIVSELAGCPTNEMSMYESKLPDIEIVVSGTLIVAALASTTRGLVASAARCVSTAALWELSTTSGCNLGRESGIIPPYMPSASF